MSRDNPRRPASSRTPVSRPRRVAGQGNASATPASTESEVVEPEVVEPEVTESEVTETAVAPATGRRGMGALFESRRATGVLVALIVVLAVVAGGLAVHEAVSGSDPAEAKPPPKGQIAVPDGRPVLITGDDATTAAAAAAKAATTIVSRSYEDYDKQVDAATAMMTDDFAAKYRQTTDDIKTAFVKDKTEVQVRIVAQGVVRANTSQVQVLLFLNQYVSKDGGDTTYTPYRALVTMVHTDRGWLVSDLDTQ